MTSLPAQIEAVRDTIMAGERVRLTLKLSPLTDWNQDCLRAVLVTLQQHERLEAEIAEMEAGYKNAAELVLTYHGKNERLEAVVKAARIVAMHLNIGILVDALAALDTAAPDKPEDAERGLRRDG